MAYPILQPIKKPATPLMGAPVKSASPFAVQAKPAITPSTGVPQMSMVPQTTPMPTVAPASNPTPAQTIASKPPVPSLGPTASPVPTMPKTPQQIDSEEQANRAITANASASKAQAGTTSSTTPATPLSSAESAYQGALKQTPEEQKTQEEIDLLSESAKKAYQNTKGQAIPLEFITGQTKAIEERALGLMEPLEKKLARMQASRTSSLEASKFALERADKAAEAQKPSTMTVGKGQTVVRYNPATGKTETIAQGAPEDRKTSVTEIAGRKVLVDTETGETIKDLGSTEKPEATAGSRNAMDQINLVKGALERSRKLADASGNTGIIGKTGRFLGGADDFTNLVAETNTLRTNVLTMMTDPTIKKFFGPQMSNADVQLMTSAGTTLNPELQSPENLKTELTRLEDFISRAEKAVQAGLGGSETNAGGSSTPATMVLNGKTLTLQADGTYE